MMLSTGAFAFVLLVSAALTMPSTLVLVWLYQRAVRAAMVRHSSISVQSSAEPQPAATPKPLPTLTLTEWRPTSRLELDQLSRAMQRRALAGPWRNAAVYAVAGLGFGLCTALLELIGGQIGVLPLRLTATTLAYAFPVVIAINLVTAASRWVQLRNVAIYALVALTSQSFNVRDAPLWWLTLSGPPSLVLLAFMHRKVRTMGPLVFVFMSIGVFGANLLLIPFNYQGVQWAVADASVATGLDVQLFLLLAIVVGFGVAGLLAWVALGWVRRRYEAKQISDQSLQIDAIFAIFAVSNALDLANVGLVWALLGLAVFGVYRALVSAGFKLTSQHTKGDAPRLLLLRVFGSAKRSEQLMTRVGGRWRYVGSIEMIAGTDLATETLEPHEFLEFVRGRIANRYIQSPDALERHLSECDLASDFDGRFRINEFLSYDDTWRLALSRLVAVSNAVLMDLRGFSPTNQGCVFELHALVNLAPVARVVLIADSTTDATFLKRVLDEALANASPMSPNLGIGTVTVNVCQLSGQLDQAAVRLVLGRVAQAAASSARVQDTLETQSVSGAAALA